MKRKVIKQGQRTLTVTLPTEWTNKNKIKAGEELDLEEADNRLILSKGLTKDYNEISINIDRFNRLAIAKLLMACYEQGIDKMTLNFSKEEVESWCHGKVPLSKTIDFFVSRLIGFEIVNQGDKSFTIENLSEKMTRFEDTLSRIFFLIEDYLQNFIEQEKSGKHPKDGEPRHDNITKFISLASRIIMEDNKFSKVESLNYFTILNILDKIADMVRYVYEYSEGKKLDKETIMLAEKTLKYFKSYRHFFYKFSYDEINDLDELRGEMKKSFINTKEDLHINSQFNDLVEVLHGIIKCRVAIEISKNKKHELDV